MRCIRKGNRNIYHGIVDSETFIEGDESMQSNDYAVELWIAELMKWIERGKLSFRSH